MIKRQLKNIANGFCTLIIFPLFLANLLMNSLFSGDSFFWASSQLLSLIPGLCGSYLRKNYYALTMTRCFRDGVILFGTIFSQKDTEIGNKVYIGPQCNIGSCIIENFCTIGSGVHILSGSAQHGHEEIDIPIQQQSGLYNKITIGENTWIGNCAVIMANVGKKCIVGAGTVVIKDVDDFSVVVGNPGRVIRKRNS